RRVDRGTLVVPRTDDDRGRGTGSAGGGEGDRAPREGAARGREGIGPRRGSQRRAGERRQAGAGGRPARAPTDRPAASGHVPGDGGPRAGGPPRGRPGGGTGRSPGPKERGRRSF